MNTKSKFVKFGKDCGEFKTGDVVEMDDSTAETLCKMGFCAETEAPAGEDEVGEKIEKALAERDSKIVAQITKAMASEVKVSIPATARDHSDESFGDYLQCLGRAAIGSPDIRTKAFNKLRDGYKVTASEGVNADGGYTVPVQYAKELLFVPGYDGAIYPKYIQPRPMGSKSLVIPALDQTLTPSAGQSAFYGGVQIGIVAEGTAPSANTQSEFKQVVLTAKKALATTVISNELLEDSIISMENYIKDVFQRASTWWINWSIFNGAGGSSALTGIINNGATISTTRQVANQVSLQDLGKMYARLAPDSRKNAVWFINPLVWAQLIMLGSTGGAAAHYVWVGNDAHADQPPKLFGLPVVPTELLPALGQVGDCVLADGRYYAFGMRHDITIDVSPHYLFPADQVVYRLKFRVDGAPQLTAPILLTQGGTNNSVSPFIQLGVVGS